jgi:hypothetical protein
MMIFRAKKNIDDMPILMFHPCGVYSVKSSYGGVVNNAGVVPIHTPVVWKLIVSPRIHIFLWLLTNNKIQPKERISLRAT